MAIVTDLVGRLVALEAAFIDLKSSQMVPEVDQIVLKADLMALKKDQKAFQAKCAREKDN